MQDAIQEMMLYGFSDLQLAELYAPYNYALKGENEFYMEAILMEYAAIESRLEVMLGLIGMPCNKFIEDKERKKVQISHRISCVKKFRKNSPLFEKTKLSSKFFDKLENWIAKRNMPAYKVGRLWKFKLSEVDDWIRSGGAAEE